MTLTRSQLHERITDLSGQYRAAQENKRLTSAKREEQERLTDLARQADEKADELLTHVRDLINGATTEYAGAVDYFLDGPAPERDPSAAVEPEPPAEHLDAAGAPYVYSPDVHGAHFGDFGHPAQNGALDQTAMNTAFDTARTPQ